MNTTPSGYYSESDCSIAEFSSLLEECRQGCNRLSFATSVEKHIPIYDCLTLQSCLTDDNQRRSLSTEWMQVFRDGAGIILLKNAYADTAIIDQATDIFHQIIAAEKSTHAGDHFAASGANDRIWNAHEKLCRQSPEIFVWYYANQYIHMICEAWLGPQYQMTAQVNQVRPGGTAQQPHRDYHLGFQTVTGAERYPADIHRLSQYLTLQGAVAHNDMSIDMGPTKMLPYSQKYLPGYVAWRRQDFIDYFEQHFVQLPFNKGDALFFNPAVFHASGENRSTDSLRMANLLQVSSAFASAMETLDRTSMCLQIYPIAKELKEKNMLSPESLNCAITSCAQGYPFPTCLDTDPPLKELAPQSQFNLFHQALDEGWATDKFAVEMDYHIKRKSGISQ